MEVLAKSLPAHLRPYGLLGMADLIDVIENKEGLFAQRLSRSDIRNLARILEFKMTNDHQPEIIERAELEKNVKKTEDIVAIVDQVSYSSYYERYIRPNPSTW